MALHSSKHLGLRHPMAEKFSRRYSMAVNV
jgi:hypothetical protein